MDIVLVETESSFEVLGNVLYCHLFLCFPVNSKQPSKAFFCKRVATVARLGDATDGIFVIHSNNRLYRTRKTQASLCTAVNAPIHSSHPVKHYITELKPRASSYKGANIFVSQGNYINLTLVF